ncbi:MAG: hypothetical protein J6B95_08440, partial [Oscillospiraceae bacterium]|nr:hypothetical protein [Oscillospiraceae bacterium]
MPKHRKRPTPQGVGLFLVGKVLPPSSRWRVTVYRTGTFNRFNPTHPDKIKSQTPDGVWLLMV